MIKLLLALIALSCLPLFAQDDKPQDKFTGTWEAKWMEKVICTIRLKPGAPVSGEMDGCSIHVDNEGNLQAPETEVSTGNPDPILNVKQQGDTLSFEEKDGDETTKFEFKLVRDGKAELTVVDAPVKIKPISFSRK